MALLNIVFLLHISPISLNSPPPTPHPHICAVHLPSGRLQQEASRSVCSGHSGQELKCSEEEPGRVSTAFPGAHSAGHRRRPACREPRGQRAEEQVLEAQQRQRRAAAAQVLPGPEEAGQPREERSRSRHHRGIGVSRGERSGAASSGHPRQVEAGAPQSPAPGTSGAGRRRGRGQRGRAFWGLEASRRDE